MVIPTEACNGMSANFGGCPDVGEEAEPVPVDILLVVDRSTSMGWEPTPGTTRMELVADGVEALLHPTLEEPNDRNGERIGEGGRQSECVAPDDPRAAFGVGELPISGPALDQQRERELGPAAPAVAMSPRRIVVEDFFLELYYC